jgi:hypothetical protein
MKVSAKLIEMIKHDEGVRVKPYRCPALLWTVGVGHVIDQNHIRVPLEERKALPIPAGWDRILTMEEVNAVLAKDLENFERGVLRLAPNLALSRKILPPASQIQNYSLKLVQKSDHGLALKTSSFFYWLPITCSVRSMLGLM